MSLNSNLKSKFKKLGMQFEFEKQFDPNIFDNEFKQKNLEGKYKENNHFRKCPLTFIHLSWSRVNKDPLFLNLKKLKVLKSTVHKRRSERKENTCQRKV